MIQLRKHLLVVVMLAAAATVNSQEPRPASPPAAAGPSARATDTKPGIKPYKEVITEKAKTDDGFFTVHKIDDKYYFEIADSLINREWMVIVRTAKTSNGIGYGGEESNRQTLRWERGPDNKIYLRVVSYFNVSTDESPISTAVKSSNTEAIVAAFDIKSTGKDSSGVVIDVTDLFKGESPVLSVSTAFKRTYSLQNLLADRSYVQYMRSFPKNTEIRTVKTFSAGPSTNPQISVTDAGNVGIVTLELNTSLVMLPKIPMQRRFADERVGYFTNAYTNYSLDKQRAADESFIRRWRLEPKAEDVSKMMRGELVEPANPIVYYIDPATPVKWRKYLKLGVEDWSKAFEKAGFKNAILAKDFPENDSTISPEDVRFSMIRYFASDIPNAYGPQTYDPRSGEVIQSHIGWYHNVMQILRNWYLIQTAAVDPRARKGNFDDELMGDLIRFVSSHEIGHTLGLLHNFGSSSSVPVEKLRDKAWVEANGHTPSIMDYARFNYVAQPEDNIGIKGIYPRINDYDEWAIEFGYKLYGKTEYQEKQMLNELVKERLKNKRLIYLRQRSPAIGAAFTDPRAQNEDLSDNAMIAGAYGIKNLQRILPNLPVWLKESGEDYAEVDEVYGEIRSQFVRYLNHAAANVGGVYETPATMDQEGVHVFMPVPKSKQQEAMKFLHAQVFTKPEWLYDFKILKQFNQDQVVDEARAMQESVLNNLLNTGRFARLMDNMAMEGASAYTLDEFITDLRKSIWGNMSGNQAPGWYERNFQKIFVEKIGAIIKEPATVSFPPGLRVDNPRRYFSKYLVGQMDVLRSDVLSVLKAALRTVRSDIKTALPRTTDNVARYHYADVAERIDNILAIKK